MNAGPLILALIPVSLTLLIVNCIGWAVVRLHGNGLPVRMGMGWPWIYYTYEVNRVGPSHFDAASLLLDIAVGLGILAAVAALVLLVTALKKRRVS